MSAGQYWNSTGHGQDGSVLLGNRGTEYHPLKRGSNNNTSYAETVRSSLRVWEEERNGVDDHDFVKVSL